MHNASFLLLLSLGREDCSTQLLQDKTGSSVLHWYGTEQNIPVGRDLQWSAAPNLCRCSRPSKWGDTTLERPDPFRKPHFISGNTSLCPSQLYSQNIHFIKLTPQTSTFLPCSKLCSIPYSTDEAEGVKRWPLLPDSEPPTPWTGWSSFWMLQHPALPFQWENWSPSS